MFPIMLSLLSLMFLLVHVVQCVEDSSSLLSSSSSSSSSSSLMMMLKKRATTVSTTHLHRLPDESGAPSSFSSSSSSSSSLFPSASKTSQKKSLLLEEAASDLMSVGADEVNKEKEDGCAEIIHSCLNNCNHQLDCEVGCGARASVMYFSHYEVADDAVTKACDNKCHGHSDGKLCGRICNKGFRDHYYMQPKEDRLLYCANTVKTRVNEFIANNKTLTCAVDCQNQCGKSRKFGTMAHATCAVHCTHNAAHAYFELMKPTIQRIHKECGSEVECVHSYADSWILTSDECDDGVLDWPSVPADVSYCADWCDAFYDTTLPNEMNWAHSCTQGCEKSYDKTKRKWSQKKCESLCGEPPKTAGDEEAFVSGCYSGCSPSIAVG